jgi:regulator of protease activity HflC (stomatin/prohibitin superfamily)
VTIHIDGVLYIRIVNPKDASYGVKDVSYAVSQLAQTTMRSELGKMTLDNTFQERDNLNRNIVTAINSAAQSWGVECLRYEIRDITPPQSVKVAMDMQAEAERRKRADISQSEGERQAAVNIAEGRKRAQVLAAEAEAEGIKLRAQATAEALSTISTQLRGPGGQEAAALRVAEQYVDAFGGIAKTTNTVLLPSNMADPSSMIAQAMSVYKAVDRNTPSTAAGAASAASGGGAAALSPESVYTDSATGIDAAGDDLFDSDSSLATFELSSSSPSDSPTSTERP